MAVRTFGNYTVESMAEAIGHGSPHFRPSVRIRSDKDIVGRIEHIRHLDTGAMSEKEAYLAASGYLDTIQAVNDDGRIWDRPSEFMARPAVIPCDTFNVGGGNYNAHFVLETLSLGEYRVVRAKATNTETRETIDLEDFDVTADPDAAKLVATGMLKEAVEAFIARKN